LIDFGGGISHGGSGGFRPSGDGGGIIDGHGDLRGGDDPEIRGGFGFRIVYKKDAKGNIVVIEFKLELRISIVW
jgi:hypothetical protein